MQDRQSKTVRIIFVPGGPCLNGAYWDEFIHENFRDYPTHRHVIINHESEYLESNILTLKDAVQKLNQDIKKMGGEVILVGHSYGAWLTLYSLNEIPDYISKVILLGMPFSDQRPQSFMDYVSKRQMDVKSNEDYTTFFSNIAPIYFKEFKAHFFEDYFKSSFMVGNDGLQISPTEVLALIEKSRIQSDKIWSINGEGDQLLVDTRKSINPRHHSVISDCGHFPMLEKSELLTSRLTEIIQRS